MVWVQIQTPFEFKLKVTNPYPGKVSMRAKAWRISLAKQICAMRNGMEKSGGARDKIQSSLNQFDPLWSDPNPYWLDPNREGWI